MYVYLSQLCNAAAADAVGARFNGKYLMFYSGPPPATADAPLGGQNIWLGECQLATPAVNPADATGRFTFNLISPDVNTNADGSATFVRISNIDGTGVEIQGDVGVTNGYLAILNTTAFTLGGTVTISNGALQHHNGV